MTAQSWEPRGLSRRGFLRIAGAASAGAPAALDDLDREVAALRGRLLSEEQAAELSDGTGLVRPLTTDTTSTTDRTGTSLAESEK
jgi:hypothetical protein